MRSTPYLLGADVMHWMNKMMFFNTSCCWVLFSGCPSRSRRLLSGRRRSRWWCSAHHCWTRVNFRLNHDQESQSLPVVNISYLLGVVLVELRHPHTESWSKHLNNNKKTNDLIKSRLLTEFREKKASIAHHIYFLYRQRRLLPRIPFKLLIIILQGTKTFFS